MRHEKAGTLRLRRLRKRLKVLPTCEPDERRAVRLIEAGRPFCVANLRLCARTETQGRLTAEVETAPTGLLSNRADDSSHETQRRFADLWMIETAMRRARAATLWLGPGCCSRLGNARHEATIWILLE
jgi:hypothetical protein